MALQLHLIVRLENLKTLNSEDGKYDLAHKAEGTLIFVGRDCSNGEILAYNEMDDIVTCKFPGRNRWVATGHQEYQPTEIVVYQLEKLTDGRLNAIQLIRWPVGKSRS